MSLQSIPAPTLHQWLARGEAVLIDVREPAEFNAEHIAGATLLPLSHVSVATLPATANGQKIVLQCRKGGRGGSACQKLLSENPALTLYNLEGGIEAWEAAGYAVTRGAKRFLPLDRQVQLTIGIMLLAITLLTYFVSPAFLVMVGFIGAGLSIAGLTGFCGLARLLARMPWNRG